MNNLVSVLIGTRNRADHVLDICDLLQNQTFQDFNIIVFDDVSDEPERQKLDKIKSDKVFVYHNPGPWRFDGDLKWNAHLKMAIELGSKYILSLHDDMKVNDNDLIKVFVDFMEENDDYGGVGPSIYNGDGVKTRGGDIVKKRFGRDIVLNECYFIRLRCFLEMGLINEKLMYYGSEDYQFIWMSDHGYKTKSLDNVSVTHYGGGTSSQYQNQKDYYRPRTTILIIKLFCNEYSLYRKLRFFYNGIAEPRLKMLRFVREYRVFSFIKTLVFFTAGMISGVFTHVMVNPPYIHSDSQNKFIG